MVDINNILHVGCEETLILSNCHALNIELSG